MSPPLPPWVPAPETTADLDWAPLKSIDLSTFDTSPRRSALAAELREAATIDGFWIVKGFGIPQEAIDEQFAFADAFFKLSLEEKRSVAVDFSSERHIGYQEAREIVKDGHTIKQNVERLSIPKLFTTPNSDIKLHDFTNAHRSSLASFQRLCYDNVLKKLLILFAIMLELPEEYFLERHRFEGPSEDHTRLMKYHARPEDVDRLVSGQWIAGHTDFGSITLLFPQTIAALQIQTPTKEWKWVKPVKDGIICNAGDVLSFLTNGYIKSAIHRVIRPPPDQAHLDRISLIYFLRPGDDVPIVPAKSPVLLREGLVVPGEEGGKEEKVVVTAGEYVRERVRYVQDRYTWRVEDSKPDKVFALKGITVRDYYV